MLKKVGPRLRDPPGQYVLFPPSIRVQFFVRAAAPLQQLNHARALHTFFLSAQNVGWMEAELEFRKSQPDRRPQLESLSLARAVALRKKPTLSATLPLRRSSLARRWSDFFLLFSLCSPRRRSLETTLSPSLISSTRK